jgi:hypothetical protein
MDDCPFWSDDFDMDLPKVIPEAREICAPIGGITLWTTGHTTHGALNHPNVWNWDGGSVAFFGTRGICKPESYWTNSETVKCTAWEAIRDAWPHSYIMIVDGCAIWDAGRLWHHFETIMWDLRGWRKQPRQREYARRAVVRSLRRAVDRLAEIAAANSSLAIGERS